MRILFNLSILYGQLIRRPELRKDRSGEDLVRFCVRSEHGDVFSCFANANTARAIAAMPTGADMMWIAHPIANGGPGSTETDDRFGRVSFHVTAWDKRIACETDSATSDPIA